MKFLYSARRQHLSLAVAVTSLLAGLFLLGAAFGGPSQDLLSSGLEYVGLMGLFLLLIVAHGIALARAMPEEHWYLHPSLLVVVWVFMMLVVPGACAFFNVSGGEDRFIDYLYDVQKLDNSDLTRGMWLVWIGCLTLCAGYSLGVRHFRPSKLAMVLGRHSIGMKTTILLYLVVLGLQLLRIAVVGIAYGADCSRWGSLESIEGTLSYVERVDLLLVALLALKAMRGEWPLRPLLAVTAVQTLLAFTSGFMKPMIWLSVMVFACALISNYSTKFIGIIATVLVPLVIAIVPVTQDMRKLAGQNPNRDLAVASDTALAAFQNTWGQGLDVGWGIFTDKFIDRQMGVAFMPGLIMARTPSTFPYEGFGQFFTIPAYILPRFLWPGKPIISRGVWFSITYLEDSEETRSSTGMTIFGEGYLFTGWFGTVFASVMVGLGLALLYRNTVAVGLIPIYLGLLPKFLDVETEFTTLFVGAIQQTVALFLVYAVMIILSYRQAARGSRE
jgi:hypothetical protein